MFFFVKSWAGLFQCQDCSGILRDTVLLQYQKMRKLVKKCINKIKERFEKNWDKLLCIRNFSSDKQLFWDGIIKPMRISLSIKSSGSDLLWNERLDVDDVLRKQFKDG